MKQTEIKLDKSTLPSDGALVVFETHDWEDINGVYYEEDNIFVPDEDQGMKFKWISAYEVHSWRLSEFPDIYPARKKERKKVVLDIEILEESLKSILKRILKDAEIERV